MLRKRTRSQQKDNHNKDLMPDAVSDSNFISDVSNQRHKNNSFFSVPGLFVGSNPKNSESDSVRSPTSTLDFRIFSSFSNPFRSTRSQNEGHQKIWQSNKVGLSIIESLDDETNQSGKVIRSSDGKPIVFGRQMSVRSPNFSGCLETPKSLPKTVVFPNAWAKQHNIQKGTSDMIFQIGVAPSEIEAYGNFRSFSLDSGSSRSHLTSFGNSKSRFGSSGLVPESIMNSVSSIHEASFELGKCSSGGKPSSTPPSILPGIGVNGFTGSIPASEIELSEDYTCVRTHGPNAKVTHIFGDCILECHEDKVTDFVMKIGDEIETAEVAEPSNVLPSYPTNDFLKFCFTCRKELEGEDIYMYRGEKAFCSYACRSQEIEIDEEMERSNNNDSSEISDNSNICEENSGSSLFITT